MQNVSFGMIAGARESFFEPAHEAPEPSAGEARERESRIARSLYSLTAPTLTPSFSRAPAPRRRLARD